MINPTAKNRQGEEEGIRSELNMGYVPIIKYFPLYISPDVAELGTPLDCNSKAAGSSPMCATIFLPVGIYFFTGEYPQSMNEA